MEANLYISGQVTATMLVNLIRAALALDLIRDNEIRLLLPNPSPNHVLTEGNAIGYIKLVKRIRDESGCGINEGKAKIQDFMVDNLHRLPLWVLEDEIKRR